MLRTPSVDEGFSSLTRVLLRAYRFTRELSNPYDSMVAVPYAHPAGTKNGLARTHKEAGDGDRSWSDGPLGICRAVRNATTNNRFAAPLQTDVVVFAGPIIGNWLNERSCEGAFASPRRWQG